MYQNNDIDIVQKCHCFNNKVHLITSISFTVLFYPNELLLGPSEIIIYRSEFEFYLNEISLNESEITFDLSEILFYQSEKKKKKHLIQLKYCLIKAKNVLSK